ncbi:MAG: hypothetical protein IKQ13_03120 [Treponema sp.]|nr:hypothetical protein [Treponema sp.]
MDRRTRLLLNTSIGFFKQLIIIVCGFILPRYTLLYYGSSVTGLVSSISHFLGFITLLELGIGPVVQANLYKPLAQKDFLQVSKVLKASDVFFKKLAVVFLLYITILSFIFPIIINKEFDKLFTISLICIISVSIFAEYFFGMTSRLLLVADQKSYIQSLLHVVSVVLNTILTVILVREGFSIQIVKLVTAVIFVIRPFGQLIYVKKHYQIEKNVIIDKNILSQRWDSFAQHLAMVVLENVDVVVLSFFSTLANIAIYNVYYLVVNSIRNVIMSSITGLESLFGDLLVRKEIEKLNKTFSILELVIHYSVILIFTTTAILIVPFVSVYTHGINDANYIAPLFGFIITFAYCAQCIRVPYLRLIKGAGMFKETKIGALVAMSLNVIITIIAVIPFGLPGIAFGTFVAMFFHTLYFVIFLWKNILMRSPKYFFYHIITDIIVIFISLVITKIFKMNSLSYFAWIILAIKVFFVVFLCDTVIHVIFYGNFIYKNIGYFIKSGGNK